MDFFAEFKKLASTKPYNAVSTRSCENCAYGDFMLRSKNAYLSYYLIEAEDCYYSEYINKGRDCVDCAYLSACELCYECLDCTNLYGCSFLQDCHNCSSCNYCYDLINCKNCFGSFGLRQRQFCIFNKQYPEDEYYKKLWQFKKMPAGKIMEILQPEFDKHPRLYAHMLKGGENSFGEYIYFSRNCFNCYNVRNVSDSTHVSEIMTPDSGSSNCVDCNFASQIELCFDCQNVALCTNCNYMKDCFGCNDSAYLINCYNCNNCLGCVYLENKEYCILNRQFTREEYKIAALQIKAQLKEAGLHGKQLAEVLLA